MLYGTLITALGSSTLEFTAQWDPEQKQTHALGALLFLDLPTSKQKEELYYEIESVYAAQANLGSTCSSGWATPAPASRVLALHTLPITTTRAWT